MAEECADCLESFGSPADLVAHRKVAHPAGTERTTLETNPARSVPYFECVLCRARFRSPIDLSGHNLEAHAPKAEEYDASSA